MTEKVVSVYTKTPEEIENETLSSLKLRYNSLAEAAIGLQDENRKMRNLVSMWEQKLENAQKNVDINQAIAKNALTSQNSMKDGFVLEIDILKEKLKKAQEALK